MMSSSSCHRLAFASGRLSVQSQWCPVRVLNAPRRRCLRQNCRARAARQGPPSLVFADWGALQASHIATSRSHRLAKTVLERLGRVSPLLGSPDLYRRLAVVIGLLALYRLGCHIPVPGTRQLAELVQGGSEASKQLAHIFGTDAPANLFSLSVGPLMNAHLILGILQLLPAVRQHMGLLRQQGQSHVVEGYVTSLFAACGVVQAVALSYGWFKLLSSSGTSPGWPWIALSSSCLMAGATMCRMLCTIVEERGLGDGLGLFIATGTSLGYFRFLQSAVPFLKANPPALSNCLVVAALIIPLVAVVIWVQGAELRLPLAYHRYRAALKGQTIDPAGVIASLPALKFVSSREAVSPGSESVGVGPAVEKGSFFPISLSPQGTRTLLFVNFWVAMFRWPLSKLGLERLLASPWMYAALIFMVEAPNIGDTSPQLAEYLAMGEAGIVGVSPGMATAAVLSRKRQQLHLLNAAFLSCVWLVTALVDALIEALVGVPAGVLQLLLLVSIYTGASRQLAALSTLPKLEMEIGRERELMAAAARQV